MANIVNYSGNSWPTSGNWANAFETADLASLANGSSIVSTSTPVANATSLQLMAAVSFRLASISPAAPANLALYLIPLLDDGSTYADGESTSTAANQPVPTLLVGTAQLRLKASSTQNIMIRDIIIPPGTFKWCLISNAGVALSASTNVAKYILYSYNLNGS